MEDTKPIVNQDNNGGDETVTGNVVNNQDQAKQKISKKQKRKTRLQRYKEKQPKPDYKPIVRENDNFTTYYKAQSFLLEGEFDQFMKGLQETLPASFRINSFDYGQANFLRHLVEGPEFKDFLMPAPTNDVVNPNATNSNDNNDDKIEQQSEQQDNIVVAPPVLEPLTWYPGRLAWQMNITRIDLKKAPLLQELRKFIMAETDNGFISRQEAVSMIPPLLLDIHRGQNILDMCAAPGSKTAQLLEYLSFDIMSTGENDKFKTNNLFDDGLVVANDVDNKRCYMLVHQSSRLNSPNCVIINQDASRLPDIKTINSIDNNEAYQNNGDKFENLKFDRILCDVPCSGDGTMRKNPDVWRKWTVGNANNFHSMQCRILKRGIELLKENGILVYSTCSMNPVEDEAVIANLLRTSQGKVVLEDVSNKIPNLKYRPGISKWTVMSKDLKAIPSHDQVPKELINHLHSSLFEPTEEESNSFNLDRCIRILPHLQNTGAFFVAVLKKLDSNLPWETDTKELENNKAENNRQANPKKRRFTGFREEPFYFLSQDDPDWLNIKKAYEIKDSFPVHQLVHRSGSGGKGKKRSLYLISKRTRDFIVANREEEDKKDFLKIINCGMKLFHRADTEAGFRICQDGVAGILPYIKDDIKVPINKDDLVALLRLRNVPFEVMSCEKHVRDKIKQGSFIMVYKHNDADSGEPLEMPLVSWKGERTVTLYVSNTYRVHLCALTQLRICEDYALKEKQQQQEQKKTRMEQVELENVEKDS